MQQGSAADKIRDGDTESVSGVPAVWATENLVSTKLYILVMPHEEQMLPDLEEDGA
jgi:hypothetical protein